MHVLDQGQTLIFQPASYTAYLDNHVFTKVE
jgi:hypothetical protein